MTSQMLLICKIWRRLKPGTAKRKVLKIKAQRISHLFHKIIIFKNSMITRNLFARYMYDALHYEVPMYCEKANM